MNISGNKKDKSSKTNLVFIKKVDNNDLKLIESFNNFIILKNGLNEFITKYIIIYNSVTLALY